MPIKIVRGKWIVVPPGTAGAHRVTPINYGTPASPAHPSNWPKGTGGKQPFWPKDHKLTVPYKKKP
jgi:hypothetical protein